MHVRSVAVFLAISAAAVSALHQPLRPRWTNHCDWTCGHYKGPLTSGDCYGRCKVCAQCIADGAPMPRNGNDDLGKQCTDACYASYQGQEMMDCMDNCSCQSYNCWEVY